MAEISDETVIRVVADIDRDGFGMIPDVVGPDDLATARRFVAEAIRASDGEYACFVGADAVDNSGLDELGRSAALHRLMKDVYERGTGRTPPEQGIYQVLRCLSGRTGRKHSYQFHFDSYVVTMLIPLEIPTEGKTGDLVMLPNARRVPKSRFRDLVEKALLLNGLTQWALRRLVGAGVIRPKRLTLVPGNAYFFWGARSIHTNEFCDPTNLRATALFHFANPYADSALFAQPIRRATRTAR